MDEKPLDYEEVAQLALQLSPADKVRLIERLAFRLRFDIGGMAPTPTRSLLGALAHLGPAPSAEEIDEARREMCGGWQPEGEAE